jgi:DNA-binding response OmpR family regulator
MAHILIADDDESVLKLLATILAKAGHAVTACPSGGDCLMELGINPFDASLDLPDLIILDIMMPKVDGYSVGHKIRNDARARRVPILVISALREMSRLFTVTVEVQGFLHKPFSPEELIAEVGRILKSSRPAGK